MVERLHLVSAVLSAYVAEIAAVWEPRFLLVRRKVPADQCIATSRSRCQYCGKSLGYRLSPHIFQTKNLFPRARMPTQTRSSRYVGKRSCGKSACGSLVQIRNFKTALFKSNFSQDVYFKWDSADRQVSSSTLTVSIRDLAREKTVQPSCSIYISQGWR